MGPLVVRDRPLCFVEGYLGQPIDNHGPVLSQTMFLKAIRGFISVSRRRELSTLLEFFNLVQHENQWHNSALSQIAFLKGKMEDISVFLR